MIWNDDTDLVIRQGRADGLSARSIAETLGCSRDAVLGRSFRLGLCSEKAHLPAEIVERRRAAREEKAALTAERRSLRVRRCRVGLLIERIRQSQYIIHPVELASMEAIIGAACKRSGMELGEKLEVHIGFDPPSASQ